MDYSKISRDELISLVRAVYEYKDETLASNYFNKIAAKNDFIDRIKEEISRLPTHKNGDVKDDITYNQYGENDGVESEHTFKKRTLALIQKLTQEAEDSPYLSKDKKTGILKSLYMNIRGMEMSDEDDIVFERWATGFRKWYVLPAIDKVRDYPVFEDKQNVSLYKKREIISESSTALSIKRRKFL
ncbi:hypothetical protein GQ105_003371 [Salmonella enterica]|nr:hypothetical protein [Salmonella enterica]